MGLQDIPIPEDFYDGPARKAQADVVEGLTLVPTVAELTQGTTLRGDALVKVVDAAGNAVTGKHLVRVWYGTTAGGAPSGTDNTVAVEADAVAIQAVTANAHYLVLTDADGEAELRVTVAGAGDRYIHAEVGGRVASAKLEIAVID